MVMAMVKDLRVIMVKLADRLHNMRTLGVMAPQRRTRIAKETLDIYAPIANRLGMNELRLELEDLGFAAYHPMRYRILKKEVKKACGENKESLTEIENSIKTRLTDCDLRGFQVIGREKHLYSSPTITRSGWDWNSNVVSPFDGIWLGAFMFKPPCW